MLPTPEQQAELEANATGPNSIAGIAFNANHPKARELTNIKLVRQLSPASVGGVASARGLVGMYAAAISGSEPLLHPETAAEFAQIHSIGDDLATATRSASIVSDDYPVLGQGAFGHSGAAGSQAFADPRSGLAYGYNRRRFAFPGGAAPENARQVHAAATA